MLAKLVPYSAAWEKLANDLARSYGPSIYPCGKCNHPVINGYCCTYCLDENPQYNNQGREVSGL